MFRSMAFGALLLLAAAMPALGQRSGSPDLAVTITQIVPGRDGSVSVVVTNQGRERASRAQLSLTVSDDGRRTIDVMVPALAAGRQTRLVVPAVLPPGARIVVVVDTRNRIAESDETNNGARGVVPEPAIVEQAEPPAEIREPEIVTLEPEQPEPEIAPTPAERDKRIDLAVELLSWEVGRQGSVTVRVTNLGSERSPRTRVVVQVSGASSPYFEALPALSGRTSRDLKIAADVPPGARLVAIVDPDRRVDERNEDNNRSAVAVVEAAPEPEIAEPVREAETPKTTIGPDLVVEITKIVPGEPLRVFAKVTNLGQRSSREATVTLFVNAGGPQELKASVSALRPRASANVAFQVELTAPTLQAFVDSGLVVAETNEDNNRSEATEIPAPVPVAEVTPEPPEPEPQEVERLPEAVPVAMLGDMPVAIVPGIVSGSGEIAGRTEGDPPRRVAVLRSPEGDDIRFVENELTVDTDLATAVALAERYNGEILASVDRPKDTGRPSTYLIRIDTSLAEFDPPDPQSTARAGLVSSEAALGMLAIVTREMADGVPAFPDLVMDEHDIFLGQAPEGIVPGDLEANPVNSLTLSYVQAGGVLDVNLVGAWQMLEMAGAPLNNVRIGIIDAGFIDEPDMAPFEGVTGYYFPKKPSPFHGTMVSSAAGAPYGNSMGAAGPAGRAATLLYFKHTLDVFSSQEQLWNAWYANAGIINMSFGGTYPRITDWFGTVWPPPLESFEDDTVYVSQHGLLLFASAGNDGVNVDTLEDDTEDKWKYPCENEGVHCVAGWEPDTHSHDPGSNYGEGRGNTVDIYGPFGMWVGPYPGRDDDGASTMNFVYGTSFASPFVSGVAALVWNANPSLSNDTVFGLLLKYARPGNNINTVNAYGPVREALMLTGASFPPKLVLTSPGPSVVAKQTKPVHFSALAFDIEDEAACCDIQWVSDVDGPLGSGPFIDVAFAGLPVGSRTVTATATDSSGFTAEQSVVVQFGNSVPTLTVKQPVEGAQLVSGFAYDWRAEIIDDSVELAIALADCKGLVWTTSDPADPQPIAEGCLPKVSFASPGKRTVVATYTDAYGEVATAYVGVEVANVGDGGGSDGGVAMAVDITDPVEGHAFTSTDDIQLGYQLADPGAGANPQYKATWQLGRDEADLKVFVPQPGGGAGTTSVADVFPDRLHSTTTSQYLVRLTIEDPARPGAKATATRTISFLPEVR